MKNKMMRIASILMVAVLLTVCAVSGTFAKYVTKADIADTARVAKWGVLLSVTGDDLFSENYEADDETYTKSVYTVEASENATTATVKYDKLVAPGTPHKETATATTEETGSKAATAENKPFTIAISGTPEVAVRIVFEFGEDFKDVVLPKGEYTDFTQLVAYDGDDEDLKGTYGYYNTFKLDEDYYPVVFTLTQTKAAEGATVAQPIKGSLTQIKTALATQFKAADYAPNTVLDAEFTLTWEWAFENGEELTVEVPATEEGGQATQVGTGIYEFDAADTFLGNVAAGIVTADNISKYATNVAFDKISTEINFALAITVTQID